MKLTTNEKILLELLLEDPQAKNTELAKKINITTQAIGKIKKQLIAKGYIKSQEIILDYSKLGVSVHAIALIKIMPGTLKKLTTDQLNSILQPTNAIRSYALPETDVTHIIIYAFRNISEYDNYFRKLLTKFEKCVEIKHSFVFSSESIIKSSSKNLFLDILKKENSSK